MKILERYFDMLRALPAYEPRSAQETMVQAVMDAMEKRKTIVVEAGTGAGKSFGYLIPALFQSARPIVISTGTIALQEQLLQKDIPFLAKTAGLEDLKVRLVKGRGNYVCLQKLLEVERNLVVGSREWLHINVLKGELERGWDGDSANLDIPLPKELWEEIRSDTDDCLGRKCAFYERNPYRLARENLEEADIIIANHALYLQDVASGQGVLPPHEIVVFDEAHHLKRIALGAFTARIGKYATTKLLRKIHRRMQAVPEAMLSQLMETEASILQWLFRGPESSGSSTGFSKTSYRLNPDKTFLELAQRHVESLQSLFEWMNAIDVRQMPHQTSFVEMDPASENTAGRSFTGSFMEHAADPIDRLISQKQTQKSKLLGQLQNLAGRWEYFLSVDPFAQARVNWVELDRDRLYFEMKSTPLNVDHLLQERLWPEKACVLTSATLSVSRSLSFFNADIGIENPIELVLPSPFDYTRQCALYMPETMPDPNSFEFTIAAVHEVERILTITQGRAFVLFTSFENMMKVSAHLIPQLPFPCKVQGELPRNRLIEWFKTTPNSVLFATATFWEGIDIPGESLSCVIIDKIPFSHPDDPVNQAMVDYLKLQGKDWFNDFVLPQAAIRLKQGFGRLIRSKSDTGMVAFLDPRLKTKGYGRKIRKSLPDVAEVYDLANIINILPV